MVELVSIFLSNGCDTNQYFSNPNSLCLSLSMFKLFFQWINQTNGGAFD